MEGKRVDFSYKKENTHGVENPSDMYVEESFEDLNSELVSDAMYQQNAEEIENDYSNYVEKEHKGEAR